MTKPNRQQASRDRWRLILSGYLGMFADLPPGSVLAETSHGIQHNPPHAPLGLAEVATKCGSLVVTNRLLRASHTQLLTLACTTVHPKRPRTAHPWQSSNHIRAESNKLHKQHIQREIRQVPNPAEAISA